MKKEALIATVIAIGCISICLVVYLFSTFEPIYKGRSPGKCTFPPEGFSEADLVGTWVAGTSSRNDTLTIRADGRYKQSIHVKMPVINYESDWQHWRLERGENGIPYLHLEEMRLCGLNPEISCDQPGGDGYDFCRNEYLPRSSEGILLVLGVPEGFIRPSQDKLLQRGIDLWYPLGSENTWVYTLQEP